MNRRNRIFLTPGIPEFPFRVFPFCHSPRRHCHHLHQKHRYMEGGRRAVYGESSQATIYPTWSPSVPVCPSVERVVTRVRHTPTSRCFPTAFGNSTCLGTCQSQRASRGVSASLGPTSTEHYQVLGRDAIWICRAWKTVRIWNPLEGGPHTKNANPAVTSRNKLFTSSALKRWTALREAGCLEGFRAPCLCACCCARNARILADRERMSSGRLTSGPDGPD